MGVHLDWYVHTIPILYLDVLQWVIKIGFEHFGCRPIAFGWIWVGIEI